MKKSFMKGKMETGDVGIWQNRVEIYNFSQFKEKRPIPPVPFLKAEKHHCLISKLWNLDVI